MKPSEAAKDICQALESACLQELSDQGRSYVETWCLGTGRDQELRVDIFASEEGPALVVDLCDTIEQKAGPALNGLCSLMNAVAPGAGDNLSPIIVYAVGLILGLSHTRLCNSDPPPS